MKRVSRSKDVFEQITRSDEEQLANNHWVTRRRPSHFAKIDFHPDSDLISRQAAGHWQSFRSRIQCVLRLRCFGADAADEVDGADGADVVEDVPFLHSCEGHASGHQGQ